MEKILDVGVGENPKGNINVDIVKTRFCNVIADIQYLPFKDRVFDRVFCLSVLEHVADPVLAIQELSRVLKIHGIAEIGFPRGILTNLPLYRFVELFVNFPFSFRPSALSRLYRSMKGHKNQDPRWYHKHYIPLKLISDHFKILKIGEYGDIFYSILNRGNKSRLFKNKPQWNTSYYITCIKLSRA